MTLTPTEPLVSETTITGYDALSAGSLEWFLVDQGSEVEMTFMVPTTPQPAQRESGPASARDRWAAMVQRALEVADSAPQYEDDPEDVAEREALADGLVRGQAGLRD